MLKPASVIMLSETESCEPEHDSYHNAIRLPAVNAHPSYSYIDRLSANSRAVALKVGPKISKIHINLIRAVTCAGFTLPYAYIGSRTASIGAINVETVVRNRDYQQTVAVSVDAARSRLRL